MEGTHGTFRLSEYRGEKVVLLFYPGDETTVCTKRFCSYRDNSEAFGALGVTAVGISGQGRGIQEGASPRTTSSTSPCWQTPTYRWPPPMTPSRAWAWPSGR
ncbi:MAG: redoxin domain-containing protein [Thermoleophilaceae bacterium]